MNRPIAEGLVPRYHDGVTPVQLGDRVRMKIPFFIRVTGAVVYVPGVSPEREEMTFNGISSVGVRDDKHDLYTAQIHPETGLLKKSVAFIARGPNPGPLGADDRFFVDDPSHES